MEGYGWPPEEGGEGKCARRSHECQACLCDDEPLVLCTDAHLLTQGSYFPQNNAK